MTTVSKSTSEESVSVYLRMPKSSRATLEEMARHLDLKPSKVTNALFRFVTHPLWFEGWTDYVTELRAIVERQRGRKICLHDFTFDEWQDRKRMYGWLERMGLIEEFDFRRSANYARRIICSFKVSDAGRVVALIFSKVGVLDDIAQDEFDEVVGVNVEADEMVS
jgi:hypothetical protein